ncbi:GNAT family N-acetyltransferase [Rummeliibacillus sp. SL167]|uniref:GNAT family N-acetyltransferase n=1 Tax=Rummeliibacillus sp. SL167 TaxID=2579792 RepID=UPI0011B508EC|nr:GNAT family N-acetyltransferase [Rummeliibacillus sp. SL167]
MNYTFRQATLLDAKVLLDILLKAYEQDKKLGINFDATHATLPMVEQHLKRNICYFLQIDGQPVATISLRMPWGPNPGPEKVPHIGWFATHPDYEKQGLGTRLLSWVENTILKDQMKVPYVTLGTADTHPWLVSMYQRKGYEIFTEKDLGKGHITIYLKKFLLEEEK